MLNILSFSVISQFFNYKKIHHKSGGIEEYSGEYRYDRMYERDSNSNQISSIGRWKKTETKTALQINLQSGSMGLKWFHDSNPWFLQRCQGSGF